MTQQAQKPAPLGRGLSALFGDADASYAPKPATLDRVMKTLPVNWLRPGAMQPRQQFDEAAIEGLAESIAERGILQPIMVRPLSNAKDAYEIIAGERRWRAAQRAGLHEVPVIIRELSDRESLEIGLIENVQRQDLSPLEEAEGYQKLMEDYQHTQDGLARTVGKSRSHIANMMRLLTLPPSVKKLIDDGALSAGHARALITTKNPAALAEEIVKKNMSVRQAEDLARRDNEKTGTSYTKAAKTAAKKASPDKQTLATNDIRALEKQITDTTGYRCKLSAYKDGSGSLALDYHDLDQLDAIIKKLTIT
jgi:ParB family transcriptional regulator, chromosome partitioning protein